MKLGLPKGFLNSEVPNLSFLLPLGFFI